MNHSEIVSFIWGVEPSWSFGTQQNIGMGVISNLPLVLPPVDEQRTMPAFLDREIAKIDALISKIQEAVERLKEYRTALISAAVTGKIDVRGFVEDRVEGSE
jgi:type I restriction enzyme S subunit